MPHCIGMPKCLSVTSAVFIQSGEGMGKSCCVLEWKESRGHSSLPSCQPVGHPPPDRAMQSTVKRLVLNNHFQDSFKLQKKLETHLDWNLKLCTTKTQKKIQDKLSCRHSVTIKHSNMAEQNVQQKKKIQNKLSCTHCNNQAQSIAEENVSRKMHRGWRARCCKDIYNTRLSQHLINRPLEYSKRPMWTYLSSEEKGEEDLYCRKNSQP
jgi:hypothetical protein